MTHPPLQPVVPIQIQTPCPMSWEQLSGGGKMRYCSRCSLHVHDGAQLTRHEAQTLVSEATERVCMRLQFDPSGAPVFRDPEMARAPEVRSRVPFAGRVSRWVLTTAAGVLAACHRGESVVRPESLGLNPSASNVTTTMGEICPSERLGDVATPVQRPEIMGKAAMAPRPQRPPASDAPTAPQQAPWQPR